MFKNDSSRLHAYVLCDILTSFDEIYGDNLPEEIRSNVVKLIAKCDEYVGAGFVYHVFKDEKGDMDFQYLNIVEKN